MKAHVDNFHISQQLVPCVCVWSSIWVWVSVFSVSVCWPAHIGEYCLKTSIIHLLCLHIECPRGQFPRYGQVSIHPRHPFTFPFRMDSIRVRIQIWIRSRVACWMWSADLCAALMQIKMKRKAIQRSLARDQNLVSQPVFGWGFAFRFNGF